MTVSYSSTIATVHYNTFARLLLRWRGSVYKAVWPMLLAFCAAYLALALTYHFLPSETESDLAVRLKIVKVCAFASHVSSAIPVSFVLGFFVNMVVDRWWQQFSNLPTPDSICLLLSAYLTHEPKPSQSANKTKCEQRPLLFRRTIARYLNLSTSLCFHSISLSMKRKVRTLDDLVFSGLMTRHEHQIYRNIAHDNPYYFVPVVWSISLLTRAHHEGMIVHSRHLDTLVSAVVDYWNQLHTLFLFDYVNVPLVYNQVVALVVYLYLAMLVLSQQFADPNKILKDYQNVLGFYSACNTTSTPCLQVRPTLLGSNGFTGLVGNQTVIGNGTLHSALRTTLSVTPNVPIFAILSLICYAGWLRVAESHVFPFGEDDDDFEVLPLMDRNFNTSMWFVDTMMSPSAQPTLLRQDGPTEHIGKMGNTGLPDPFQYMSKIIFNQGAMGRKRTVNSHPQTRDHAPGIEIPEIAVSEPEDRPIPDLPCPNVLRRRESRHFFTGSMNRIHGDEPQPKTSSDSPRMSTDASMGPRPSLPTFGFGRPRASSQSSDWVGSLGAIPSQFRSRNPRANWPQRPFSSAQGIEQPNLCHGHPGLDNEDVSTPRSPLKSFTGDNLQTE